MDADFSPRLFNAQQLLRASELRRQEAEHRAAAAEARAIRAEAKLAVIAAALAGDPSRPVDAFEAKLRGLFA